MEEEKEERAMEGKKEKKQGEDAQEGVRVVIEHWSVLLPIVNELCHQVSFTTVDVLTSYALMYARVVVDSHVDVNSEVDLDTSQST